MTDGMPPTIVKGVPIPYTKRPFLGRWVNHLIGLYNGIVNMQVNVVQQTSTSATTAAAARFDISPDRSILTIPIPMTSFGTNTPGWHWATTKNYNPSTTYQKDEIVYISPASTAATTGLLDAGTLATVKSVPGVYVCLQTAAPTVISGTTYYRVPQIPYPVPGDPASTSNYWWLISMDTQCI